MAKSEAEIKADEEAKAKAEQEAKAKVEEEARLKASNEIARTLKTKVGALVGLVTARKEVVQAKVLSFTNDDDGNAVATLEYRWDGKNQKMTDVKFDESKTLPDTWHHLSDK